MAPMGRCVAILALSIATAVAPALAGDAAPAAPPPSRPAISPDQAAAQALLARWRVEHAVWRQQREHEAQRRFEVGKVHLDHGQFRAAHEQFLKAVALAPGHTQAGALLARTRGLVASPDGRAGAHIPAYREQRNVMLEMQKVELANLAVKARDLFRRGRYAQSAEAATRVAARARHQASWADTAPVAEEGELLIRRSLDALREQRRRASDAQRAEATERAAGLRERRRQSAGARHQALLARAQADFDRGRYDHARTLCDQLLLDDPTHGAAQALRQQAMNTARRTALDAALRARSAETAAWWDGVRAQSVPQGELVRISAEQVARLRARVAPSLHDGAKSTPAWETRIRQALQKPVSFDFVETPLQDVLSFLGSLADVTIVLDTEAVKDTNPTVTLRVNQMQLERALQWVCKLTGLRYGLRDEAVFISNRFHQQPELRMYDVSDITIHVENFAKRRISLASSEGQSGGSGDGGNVIPDFEPDEDKDADDEPLTGQRLVEFIQRTIAPGTWRTDGDPDGLGRIEEWE